MSEWCRATLAEVADIAIGGTPSRNIPAFWAEKPAGYPWLSIADLKSKFVSDTSEHISDLGAASSNAKYIPTGTTVMSFKLTVGRTAITTQPMYCNEAIAFIQPKNEFADSRWLYHELPRASKRVVTDTAVKGATLNKKKLAEIPLLLPPAVEQRKVAEILDTLDTQIRETEALITKLERIKQGLLTDLLTRGINQNGQLRPTPDQAPHLYKDSPLGWIPKEWRITSWDECTESWAMGPRFSAEKYTSDGNVATLRTTDMDSEGGINHSTMPIAKLDLRGLEQHVLKVGDFVITRSGTCGICGVFYGHSLPVLPGAFLIRFRFIASELDAEFMTMLMNSSVGNPLIARNAEGGVQKNLRGTSLVRITFPKPPVDEQMKIRRRVESVSERIAREKSELHKLRSKKVGLMDDLLTGQVRVTPLLEIKEQATA